MNVYQRQRRAEELKAKLAATEQLLESADSRGLAPETVEALKKRREELRMKASLEDVFAHPFKITPRIRPEGK
jgi:hypothetical protein